MSEMKKSPTREDVRAAFEKFIESHEGGDTAGYDGITSISPKAKEVYNSAEGGTPIPSVTESKNGMMRQWDIFSRLLEQRIVRLDGPVDDGMAAVAQSAIMWLEKTNPDEEIKVVINSPGGSVYAGMAIYDTMRMTSCPIRTQVWGMAASMGSLLLSGGDIREAAPNARIMIHQPLGGTGNRTQETDMVIAAKSIAECREMLTQIYVDHSGLDHEAVDWLIERDNWLTPQEAKELNLIDEVMEPSAKKTPKFAGIERSRDRQEITEKFREFAKTQIAPSNRPAGKEFPANDDKKVEAASKAQKKGNNGPSA